MRSGRVVVAVAVSAALVVITPALSVGGLAIDHAADYDGLCGPYAPDIPVHECSFDTYVANFFGGFAAFGLMIIAIGVGAGTLLFVVVGWAATGAFLLLRRAWRHAPYGTTVGRH